ncbi:MAG UNVERIFIED_CONTAM: toll/interleukin-1 receptor domain-containing protein [Planctomycetaceae bacterium]|jgi:4-hydroxy-3-methylbut-2-enyl diphosphate reductase IspH
MFRIFISYRRGDTRDITQRLYERIRQQFGSAVFCDVSSSCAGDDFRQQILQAAETCDAMVVVIGQHWFGCQPRWQPQN